LSKINFERQNEFITTAINGQGSISVKLSEIIIKEGMAVNRKDFDKQVWICLSKVFIVETLKGSIGC
jgi:hypothetical protein